MTDGRGSQAMKITFILPGPGHHPIGLFKVAYEHANGLARRGHDVTVVHPAYGLQHYRSPLKAGSRWLLRAVKQVVLKRGYRPDSWFQVDGRVRLLWVPSLYPRWIPEADAIVATAWQTAEWVLTYPAIKGDKFYLIHDYEHYMTAEPSVKARMAATYAGPIHNIVTSPACVGMLEEVGAPVGSYIPNGVDLDVYRLERAIDDESRAAVGFATRHEPVKATRDAITALGTVREEIGAGVRIWSFGGPRPADLPDWVAYYVRPPDTLLRALYNDTKIFVVPSLYEGWGLPGAEAMACGAALVSTDNGGVRAYAEHGRTALLSSIRDPDALARNVLRLLDDDQMRRTIAARGHEHIRQFTWDRAVGTLERTLLEPEVLPRHEQAGLGDQ